MRSALRRETGSPAHLALVYTAWAPIGDTGKVPEGEQRDQWLERVAGTQVAPDYARAFERWRTSFGRPGDLLAEMTLRGRLLVGHGTASAADVGVTVHHTWGVPVIPGSALKGLVAHYVDAVYGPEDPMVAPWEQADGQRAAWQAVTWEGRRIHRGPGGGYRQLFGAPDAEEDEVARESGHPAGAAAGIVTFHDALYVPGSSLGDRPFAVDALTVHQKTYYDSAGGSWPNDHDDPNPVGFVTVRPGARLLLALSGPSAWTDLAARLLASALKEWGVGAKTSAGYGVGEVRAWKAPPPPTRPPSEDFSRFLEWLDGFALSTDGTGPTQRDLLRAVEDEWVERLRALDADERARAASALGKRVTSKKLTGERARLRALLTDQEGDDG